LRTEQPTRMARARSSGGSFSATWPRLSRDCAEYAPTRSTLHSLSRASSTNLHSSVASLLLRSKLISLGATTQQDARGRRWHSMSFCRRLIAPEDGAALPDTLAHVVCQLSRAARARDRLPSDPSPQPPCAGGRLGDQSRRPAAAPRAAARIASSPLAARRRNAAHGRGN
jgi:hypothetical protein